MTKPDAVEDIIFRALNALNQERGADEQIEVSAETPLFGPDAQLNSLELVSVMVDIETMVAEELDQPVSLTDDAAMERDPVPFVKVSTLKNYIHELLAG